MATVDAGDLAVDHVHMLVRVLERHAPSRLLTTAVAMIVTAGWGPGCGVVVLVAVAALEVGLWLDQYGLR